MVGAKFLWGGVSLIWYEKNLCYWYITFSIRSPQLLSCWHDTVICSEWSPSIVLPWWMVPFGKYNRSPASRITSKIGSPMSSSVKLELEYRAKVSDSDLKYPTEYNFFFWGGGAWVGPPLLQRLINLHPLNSCDYNCNNNTFCKCFHR